MHGSQPDLDVCEGTIPIEGLNDEGEDESREVQDPHSHPPCTPECTEDQEEDPEEMEDYYKVCKDFIAHCCYSGIWCNVLLV